MIGITRVFLSGYSQGSFTLVVFGIEVINKAVVLCTVSTWWLHYITCRPPLNTRSTRHFQVNSPSRPASPNPAVRLVGLMQWVLNIENIKFRSISPTCHYEADQRARFGTRLARLNCPTYSQNPSPHNLIRRSGPPSGSEWWRHLAECGCSGFRAVDTCTPFPRLKWKVERRKIHTKIKRTCTDHQQCENDHCPVVGFNRRWRN